MSEQTPFRPYAPGTQPPLDVPAYLGTAKRHPLRPPHPMPQTITELSGPVFSERLFPPSVDLTTNTTGTPALGERIIVAGTITDEDGRPVPHTMVEIWQANAAGRYAIDGDQHDAPLDPHFHGAGGSSPTRDGVYRFVTVEPGIYPWPNDRNAWRPNHIHFLLVRSSLGHAAW